MRDDVLKMGRARMASTVAAVALAAFAAGCSADVARFDDGFYTGAVPQASVGGGTQPSAQVDQMSTGSTDRGLGMPNYSGNPGNGARLAGQDYSAVRTAPATRTASIERTTLAPPSSAPNPVVMSDATPDGIQPVEPAYRPRPVAIAQAPATARPRPAGPAKAGWQDTGNRVTVRNGETVAMLATRYGVPEKAIVSVNGLAGADAVKPGQSIVIPAYSYAQGAASHQVAAASTMAPAQVLGTPPGPLRVPSPTAAAPIPVRQAAVVDGEKIVVVPGQSLNGIAQRHGISPAALRAANGIGDDGNIRIGQTLILPKGARAEPTRVASIDPSPMSPSMGAAPAPLGQTRQPKAYEPPHKAEPVAKAEPAVKPAATAKAELPVKSPTTAKVEPTKPAVVAKVEPVKPPKAAAADAPAQPPAAAPAPAVAEAPKSTVTTEVDQDVASAAPAGTGIDQFRWPVQGRVIKRFGEKIGARRNDGVNISVPRGTSVKAAENGVVIYAGDGLKEFGNTVLVKHDNGLVTVYGYADEIKVQRGATVKRGQEIATAGMTGDADSPMVHFEVRKNSAPVDPMTFLQ